MKLFVPFLVLALVLVGGVSAAELRVRGVVRDYDGDLVPGAKVTIPGVGETRTSPSGAYFFKTQAPSSGMVRVEIQAPDLLPAIVVIPVPAGAASVQGDVVLQPMDMATPPPVSPPAASPAPAAGPVAVPAAVPVVAGGGAPTPTGPTITRREVRIIRGVPVVVDVQVPAPVAPTVAPPPPEPEAPPVEITLQGHILARRRRPVADAAVWVPKYKVGCRTDATGAFQIRLQIPGTRVVDGLTLVVEHPKYDRAQLPLEIRPQEDSVIELDVEVKPYRGRLER